jgi:hypothetical protein
MSEIDRLRRISASPEAFALALALDGRYRKLLTLGTVSNLLLDRLIRLVRQNWAIVRGQIGDRREQNGDRSDKGGDRSDVCSRKR